MKHAIFFGRPDAIHRVYGQGRREQVAKRTRLHPGVVNAQNLDETLAQAGSPLSQVEVIFATWGMPLLNATHLDAMPNLRAVFYAAGSVQGFARPCLERDILVVSAWMANAVPVAEFSLAQILLSNKGYWHNAADCATPAGRGRAAASAGPGNFGETVALLGAGAIGRALIGLLRPFQVRVVVFDPFLADADAALLGVEKVSLEEAFKRALVVSNHLANNARTVKMLHRSLFAAMRPGATFINTGRGATVDEDGLSAVLRARPDLSALLDVTLPEPPLPDSPFYTLPNVRLTSHIAGSIGDEVVRMADYVLEEFDAWEAGRPLRWAVTPSLLETMA